jgi:hypothetical protein
MVRLLPVNQWWQAHRLGMSNRGGYEVPAEPFLCAGCLTRRSRGPPTGGSRPPRDIAAVLRFAVSVALMQLPLSTTAALRSVGWVAGGAIEP